MTKPSLNTLYGEICAGAIAKEIDYIHPHYRAMIEASPFLVLATCGPEGLDTSPRGDPAGFVHVVDDKTLLIPDRRGNNRADSLRNIIRDPRVALLFLIPGVGETLRVNGTAVISTDPGVDRPLPVPRHAAAHGHRRHRRARVFPMSESPGSFGAVEPGKTHRP